jgi:hypothetical protein
MSRFHQKDTGEMVPFTHAEEAEQDANEVAIEEAIPMTEWLTAIARTDKDLPRAVEDIWDVHGSPNARTQKLLDDKKALRAARP